MPDAVAPGHHAHHVHAARDTRDRTRLSIGLGLIVAFMAAEVTVGILGHSLALLGDAGHMLTDAFALALALVAIQLAARAPEGGFTYGLKRAEILSALANGLTLALLAIWVVVESAHRLVSPPPASGTAMALTAIAGIGVNLLVTWQLSGANRDSLNIQGSLRHVVTDVFAFAATGVAGVIILVSGFTRADALASLLIAALMAYGGYGLIRDAGRSLLEAAPAGLDPRLVGEALVAHPHVANVHDLHVWEITSGFPALSAHVLVHPGDDCHAIRVDLERLLRDRFHIDHTTLQVDHENDPFVHFASSAPNRPPGETAQ